MSHSELTRLEILRRHGRYGAWCEVTGLRVLRAWFLRSAARSATTGGRKSSEITFWRLFANSTPILGLRCALPAAGVIEMTRISYRPFLTVASASYGVTFDSARSSQYSCCR
jgi:hypothetical protein